MQRQSTVLGQLQWQMKRTCHWLPTWLDYGATAANQPVRDAVSYRGLFTAGWFDVREKYYSRLKIYDRLRASEYSFRLFF